MFVREFINNYYGKLLNEINASNRRNRNLSLENSYISFIIEIKKSKVTAFSEIIKLKEKNPSLFQRFFQYRLYKKTQNLFLKVGEQ